MPHAVSLDASQLYGAYASASWPAMPHGPVPIPHAQQQVQESRSACWAPRCTCTETLKSLCSDELLGVWSLYRTNPAVASLHLLLLCKVYKVLPA